MKTKPFVIPRQLLMEAYPGIEANAGATGVDYLLLDDFEDYLRGNL
jgi:hypothetical protein